MSDLDDLIAAANRHRWHFSLVHWSEGGWRCDVEWGHRTGVTEEVSAKGRTVQAAAASVLKQLRERGKLVTV